MNLLKYNTFVPNFRLICSTSVPRHPFVYQTYPKWLKCAFQSFIFILFNDEHVNVLTTSKWGLFVLQPLSSSAAKEQHFMQETTKFILSFTLHHCLEVCPLCWIFWQHRTVAHNLQLSDVRAFMNASSNVVSSATIDILQCIQWG